MDQKIILDLGADNEWSQTKPYHKSKTTYKGIFSLSDKNLHAGIRSIPASSEEQYNLH